MSAPLCRLSKSHREKPKQKYRSVEHAERMIERRGWNATVYPCPSGQNHYHITHWTPPRHGGVASVVTKEQHA